MNMPRRSVLLLLLLQASPCLGADNNTTADPMIECGPATTGSLRLAGIRSSNRIFREWSQAYAQVCPFRLEIEEDTWPDSGARMCGNHLLYPTVDISGMGGKFFRPQATTADGWNFECYRSERKAIHIKVADEGISLVTSSFEALTEEGNSEAATDAKSCIAKLGGGLNKDQVRWIFSGQSLKALETDGMDVEIIVPNYDGRDDTHLWSELHADCPAAPILLAGMNSSHHEGEAMAYLLDHVLVGSNEDIRQGSYEEFGTLREFASFLEENPNAIGFTSIGDFEYAKGDLTAVSLVGIQSSDGKYVLPNTEAFRDGTYVLSDPVTVGLLNTPEMMAVMRPFAQFGLSEEGTRILTRNGYWPIGGWERALDSSRLGLNENLGEDDGKTGISLQRIQDSCGPESQHITIAGSTNVYVVARTWAEFYQTSCATIDITLEGGGSSRGAGRVCANRLRGAPVDVGAMSRAWKSSEGLERPSLPGVYDCMNGDQSRSAIRIDIAYDGITVVVREGSIGAKCQEILGGGLTMDQLRWIYSSYSDAQLEEAGWDPSSLKNSDGDSSTHLWSELDSRCAAQEIKLSGDPVGEGTFTTFRELVLTDRSNGETIALDRPKPYSEGLGAEFVSLLQKERDAIGFIGYNHYFANRDVFNAISIKSESGKNIAPSAGTIADGSYPIVRNIFMNLHNDAQSLANTVPYVKFGLENPVMVELLGLVPIQGKDLDEMMFRLNNAPFASNAGLDDEEDATFDIRFIAGIIGGGIGLICICCIVSLCVWHHAQKDSSHD